MRANKTKRFHYKIARFNNDPEGFSLQELIEDAYGNTSSAMDCAYEFQQDGKNFHLINYFSGNHRQEGVTDFLLGAEFLSYVEGNDPIAIELDKKERELKLERIMASKQGKEVIEGAVYFGVVGNHLVFTQSTALRSQALEKYLNWLIEKKGSLWKEENFMYLCDPDYPSANQKEKYEPEEIIISSPVKFTPVQKGEEKKMNIKASGAGIDALKAFFANLRPGDPFLDEFTVEDIANSRSLEIQMQLRWMGQKDKTKPSNLLEQVSRNLRHVDDEIDYELRAKDGTTIRKDEIKKSTKISVRWNEARPVFDDLFPKMLRWIDVIRKETDS